MKMEIRLRIFPRDIFHVPRLNNRVKAGGSSMRFKCDYQTTLGKLNELSSDVNREKGITLQFRCL